MMNKNIENEVDKYLNLCWEDNYLVKYVNGWEGEAYVEKYVTNMKGLRNVKSEGSTLLEVKLNLMNSLKDYITNKIKENKEIKIPKKVKEATLEELEELITFAKCGYPDYYKYASLTWNVASGQYWCFFSLVEFKEIHRYNGFSLNSPDMSHYFKALR